MLANDWEAGPAGLLARLRERAGLVYTDAGDPVAVPGSLAEGLSCTYCNSVWIGLIFTVIYMLLKMIEDVIPAYVPVIVLFLPLALSGASVLLGKLASWLEAGR